MSFMDSKLVFWDGQALTVAEESITNGNVLDMEQYGATDAQLGFLWLNILVSVAAGGMASGAYFQFVTSDAAAFDDGSGAEQAIGCIGSANLPLFAADLAAGTRLSIAVPTRVLDKYLEVEFVPVSEAATGLTVDAWLGTEPIGDIVTQKEPT